MEVLRDISLPLPLIKSGKVRKLYDLGDRALMVTTDRVSAFDVVFEEPVPYKGVVLNRLSAFWFEKTKDIVRNHFLSLDLPEEASRWKELICGRSMVVKKADPIPVEAVVRGYLAGSSYKEYVREGRVCGIELPSGLEYGSMLPEPIFTPSTKEEMGKHDQNITFERMKSIVGDQLAEKIRSTSIELYKFAHSFALERGLILADTKFEFGIVDGSLILIDELFTPDSSRYWLLSEYERGKIEELSKQFLRDYLERLDWDKNPPPPRIPEDVILELSERYRKLYTMLTEDSIP